MHEPLEAKLRRLEQERAEADRHYNEALTAFDRAMTAAETARRRRPPDYDEQPDPGAQRGWNILPAPRRRRSGSPAGSPASSGALSASFFERQLTFNSHLVDHLNRNVRGAPRSARAAPAAVIAALREHIDRQAAIEARAGQVLQRITPFVDTKSPRRRADAQCRGQRDGATRSASDGSRWRPASVTSGRRSASRSRRR